MYNESVDSDRLALLLCGLDHFKSVGEAWRELDRQKADAIAASDVKGVPLPNFELNAFERSCNKAASLQTELMEFLQQAYWYPNSYEPIRVSDARCSLDTEQDYWNLVADREGLAQYFFLNGNRTGAQLLDPDVVSKIKNIKGKDEKSARRYKEVQRLELLGVPSPAGTLAEKEGVSRQAIEKSVALAVKKGKEKAAAGLHHIGGKHLK